MFAGYVVNTLDSTPEQVSMTRPRTPVSYVVDRPSETPDICRSVPSRFVPQRSERAPRTFAAHRPRMRMEDRHTRHRQVLTERNAP